LPDYTEGISYRTGICALSGLGAGAAIGLVQGIRAARKNPRIAASTKLTLNMALNNAGHLSARVSGHMGALALAYSICKNVAANQRKVVDIKNDAIGLGGAVFLVNLAKGFRWAAVAGAATGAIAGFILKPLNDLARRKPI